MAKKMKKIGKCNRCGDCCRMIVLNYPIFTFKLQSWINRLLGKKLPKFNELLEFVKMYNNIKIERNGKNYVICIKAKCKNLIEKKNDTTACKIYENRPEICKAFPNNPFILEYFPKCSYKFIDD